MKAIGKFRMASALIVLAAVGYIALLFVENMRDARYRTETRRNLKIIGLALHNYHDAYGSFPPAYVRGPDGKPWHSWRTLILPFIGAQNLYDRYRFDEPWDGPHNRELFGERIENYRSSLGESENEGVTTYMAVVSRRSMWPAYFPMKSEDVRDGTANTLFVVQNVGSDVIWSEPRDLNEREMLQVFDEASGRDEDDAYTHALFVDGSARAISAVVSRELLVSLMTPRFGEQSIPNQEWLAELLANEESIPGSLPEPVDSTQLKGTRVAAVPQTSIKPSENIVYCATIQIAWDMARPAPGEPIVVVPPTSLTDSLNDYSFPLSALSADAYFAEAARWDTGDDDAMQQRFRERFPGAPTVFTPPPSDPGVRFFAYLQKSLPFVDVLQRYETALRYHANDSMHDVASFGHLAMLGEGASLPVLKDTLVIRDYVSEDDFVIEFQANTTQNDVVIVAKTGRGETLHQTWLECDRRIKQPTATFVQPHLLASEPLQVPIIVASLTHDFSELTSLSIPTEAHPDRYIAGAIQTIRLRLDEYGAELISDTQLVVGENGHSFDSITKHEPPKPRRFIVDRPFLLALREKDAEAPYFVAWIANGDLMEPFVDSAK